MIQKLILGLLMTFGAYAAEPARPPKEVKRVVESMTYEVTYDPRAKQFGIPHGFIVRLRFARPSNELILIRSQGLAKKLLGTSMVPPKLKNEAVVGSGTTTAEVKVFSKGGFRILTVSGMELPANVEMGVSKAPEPCYTLSAGGEPTQCPDTPIKF